MKTNAIIRIVLFSVAILILVGILGIGLGIGLFALDPNYDWEHGDELIYESADFPEVPGDGTTTPSWEAAVDALSFDPSLVRDLNIEWAAGSITIQPGDTDTIDIREYGGGDPLVVRQNGSKLTIKFDHTEVHFGITIDYSKDLVITVPADWVCRDLEIDTASSDVEISNLTINSIDFDGASGKCNLTDCTVGELDVDTASGDIHFTGTLDYLECDAASADCIMVLNNIPRSIDMDGASGDLDITLPEDSGFSVSLDGLSTDFKSDFDFTLSNNHYVCGDGSCRIEVDAMSGSVCIRKGAATGNHHAHDETCDLPDSDCPDNHHH